jgi:hypothetical protein
MGHVVLLMPGFYAARRDGRKANLRGDRRGLAPATRAATCPSGLFTISSFALPKRAGRIWSIEKMRAGILNSGNAMAHDARRSENAYRVVCDPNSHKRHHSRRRRARIRVALIVAALGLAVAAFAWIISR